MLYQEASSFPYLHVTTSFLGLQPYDLGGLSLVSRGVSTPQALWASRPPWFL